MCRTVEGSLAIAMVATFLFSRPFPFSVDQAPCPFYLWAERPLPLLLASIASFTLWTKSVGCGGVAILF